MRGLLATLAVLATAAPAQAHDHCVTRKCRAVWAHKRCDQHHPRACVLHVIYHQRIHGWKRAWLLRVPACESGWNPWAVSPFGHRGLYQFAPRTWASTPYGRHSIFSARWQPYAAAWMAGRGRTNEWSCR